jgi:hypothetical protein
MPQQRGKLLFLLVLMGKGPKRKERDSTQILIKLIIKTTIFSRDICIYFSCLVLIFESNLSLFI